MSEQKVEPIANKVMRRLFKENPYHVTDAGPVFGSHVSKFELLEEGEVEMLDVWYSYKKPGILESLFNWLVEGHQLRFGKKYSIFFRLVQK